MASRRVQCWQARREGDHSSMRQRSTSGWHTTRTRGVACECGPRRGPPRIIRGLVAAVGSSSHGDSIAPFRGSCSRGQPHTCRASCVGYWALVMHRNMSDRGVLTISRPSADSRPLPYWHAAGSSAELGSGGGSLHGKHDSLQRWQNRMMPKDAKQSGGTGCLLDGLMVAVTSNSAST